MPKIPTFTSEARPTAQVGSVKSNLQIPLSQTITQAVSPLTNFVVKKAVQANDTQNRTEALTLENDFIRDMQTVNETIANDSVLGVNKEAANAYYKEQSNALINKYKSQATNNASQTLFQNNALTEVQKGIFRVEKQIDKNVFTQLNNQVDQKENHLLSQAILGDNNEFDYGVLQTDLTKLYTDAFTGKMPTPDLNKIINSIPGTIESFQANKDIGDNPRLAFTELSNPNSKLYSNIPIDQRQKLIKNAKGVLLPEVQEEWKNYVEAAALGKEPVPFDLAFAKKILPQSVIVQMNNQLKVIDKTILNTETLNSVPNKDVTLSLQNIKNEIDAQVQAKTIDFITGQNKKKYYDEIVKTREDALIEDAPSFILKTNDTIKNFAQEIANETNPELVNQMQNDLANRLIEEQIRLGVPSYNVKVMPVDQAENWVNTYQNSDQNMRVAMLQTLDAQFGDNNSAAMRQLLTAGLPTTAELSSYFNNPNITKIFLSFDDDKEKDRLKKFGKDNDASFNFNTLRRDIRGNKNIKNFENIIALNGGENSSVAAEKMDNIVETLTYYTLNDMFVNGSSERAARKKAIALIKDSFQVEGSYYVPTILGGKKLHQNQVDAVIDKATVIKDHYLKEWNAVPFGSTKEETINEDIVEQFNINLKEGEWRNTADGDSLIYGIILADGAFAPVQNANEEFLQFRIDSFGDYTLPGTDIQMNMQLKEPVKEDDSSASLAIDDRLKYVAGNDVLPVQSVTLAPMNKFVNQIISQEGKPFLEATQAFADEEFLTIGYGRNNENIKAGDKITLEQAKENLQEDINIRLTEIQNKIPNFSNLSENLQIALFGEYYRGSVGQSPKTIKLINEGKYDEAAKEFLNNQEYKDAAKRNRRGIRKNMEKVSNLLRKEGTI